jgi:hypothetical protein
MGGMVLTGLKKSVPATGLEGPLGFLEVEAPEFLDNRHMKVVRLSAQRTGRLYPQEGFLVVISVRGWVDLRAVVWPGRIKSLKNSSDSIGNRTRDLPVCITVPQPTTPPRNWQGNTGVLFLCCGSSIRLHPVELVSVFVRGFILTLLVWKSCLRVRC